MIAVVAKLKIREGRNAEFEAFFRGLMESVRANEPGCRLYQASKSRTDPQVYCVQELYDDAAAQEAHLFLIHHFCERIDAAFATA